MKEISDALKKACDSAAPGDRVVTIHLFGIEHAETLHGMNLKEIAVRAGISETYGTELRKGVRLAEYVKILSKP